MARFQAVKKADEIALITGGSAQRNCSISLAGGRSREQREVAGGPTAAPRLVGSAFSCSHLPSKRSSWPAPSLKVTS